MKAPESRPRRAAALALTLLGLATAPTALGADQDQGKEKEPAAAEARTGVALTVYSSADPASFDPKQFVPNPQGGAAWRGQVPGYGVVRETRRVELAGGENTVRFTDVAAGIDPTTVAFKSRTAPGSTAVLEQDYQYDLVGSDRLFQKYLGRPVTVRSKGSALNGVTLLSAEPGLLVVREPGGRDGGLHMVPRGADLIGIDLPSLPEGLITRPTLVWKISAGQAGRHEVEVSYQTDGLTWRADYNLVLSPDDKADVGAWVSLLNESGASYPDARLKLVAGDVRRVQPPQAPMMSHMMGAMAAPAPAAPGFQEKAFFEYHLYTLGRPTSLADRSTKQIELFPSRPGVAVSRTYVYYGLPEGFTHFAPAQVHADRNLGSQANKKVDVYLTLKNDEAHGLGIPLPAGRVRVYQRDAADAALEFVGEDTIQHTPKGVDVRVKLGSAFDVVGDRKVTDFQANTAAQVITETVEITLGNHKTEPVRVVIKENLFRWSSWTITRSSDPTEKQDSRTIHIPVEVKPGEDRKVRYTVRYSW